MARTLLAIALCLATLDVAHGRPRRTVTIAAVGHIVIGTDFPSERPFLPPGNGEDLVDRVAPLLSFADITLGNLAAPLSDRGKVKSGVDGERRFAFRTPPRYAPVLARLGLDVVLAANNHILDFGPDAYADTIALLTRMKIAQVGLIDQVHVKKVRGIKVATVGFTQPYRPEFQSHHDIETAGRVIHHLAGEHDIVIALVHGGGEGKDALHVKRGKEFAGSEYRGRIVELARHLVDRGADLVIGFGAHHPRALELYRGRIIAYSLGNFLTYGPFDLRSPNYLSAVLQLTLDQRGGLADAQIVPLRLRFPGAPSFDPKGRTIALMRRLSQSDFPESPLIFRPDGTLEVPADTLVNR
jgi:hypothetical protein